MARSAGVNGDVDAMLNPGVLLEGRGSACEVGGHVVLRGGGEGEVGYRGRTGEKEGDFSTCCPRMMVVGCRSG
jgi:hypothetical protein